MNDRLFKLHDEALQQAHDEGVSPPDMDGYDYAMYGKLMEMSAATTF